MSIFLDKYKAFCSRDNNLDTFTSTSITGKGKGLLFSLFAGSTRSLKNISNEGIKYVKEGSTDKSVRQKQFKAFNQMMLLGGYFTYDNNSDIYAITPKGVCLEKLSEEVYSDNVFCIILITLLDGKFRNFDGVEEDTSFIRNVIKLIGILHNLNYTIKDIINLCEAFLRDKNNTDFTPWNYEIFWLITFFHAPDFLAEIKECNFDDLAEVVSFIDENKKTRNYQDIISKKFSNSQYQTSTFIEDIELVYTYTQVISCIHSIEKSQDLWNLIISAVSFSRVVEKERVLSFIAQHNDVFEMIFKNLKQDFILSSFSALQSSNKLIKLQNTEMSNNQHYLRYLTAIRTKPFLLLAGISGTGKSRIVRKLAQATITEEMQKKYDKEYKGTDFKNDRWNLHAPANFELIQVKPNWHNSMDVVGYLSNIPSPHYVFTPFVEFVARAWQHPEIPFFLCLDEMNLAPVEEYFAEFLSAIESRSFENNEYLTDPIIKPFKGFGIVNDEKGQAISIGDLMINTLFPEFKASEVDTPLGHIVSHFKNKGLTLPKNLIVIGTVNMDETTFSFSRKVLDRAMSIEMNEVKYNMFLADTTDDGLKQVVKDFEDNKYGEGVTLNGYLVDRHIEAKEIFADGDEDAITVIDYLTRINNLLEGTPFKLGYRAANEALIYVKSAEEFKNGRIKSALDCFTLMKILSRMEGDESKLTVLEDEPRLKDAKLSADKVKEDGKITLLTCLRQIIKEELTYDIEKEVPVTPEDNNDETEQESLVNEEETTATEDKVIKKKIPVEPQSVKKLDNMIAQLRRDHFVSYWN